MFLDLLLIFLAAAGVLLLLWCLLGLVLLPVFGRSMVTLYYVKGNGEGVEQRVKAYGWLREGRIAGGRLIVVDCGLTEQGIGRVHLLQERYPWLETCQAAAVKDYIDQMQCT